MSNRTIPFDELDILPTDRTDRIDSLFASIEPTDHARRIIALADAPEMDSDILEFSRIDQYRG